MKKFTKEITALLTSAMISATATAPVASAEEIVRTAGVPLPPEDYIEKGVATIGEVALPDDYIESPTTTTTTTTTTRTIGTQTGSVTTTTTTMPPVMGGFPLPDKYTTTTRIPAVVGNMFPSDEYTETTTTTRLVGTEIRTTTTTTTTTIPPLMGTVTRETTTTTMPVEEIPPYAGVVAAPDGDINGDYNFDIADVVMLRKKLLNTDNTFTYDQWYNADLNYDNEVDIFDYVAMRNALIKESITRLITVDDIIELSRKGMELTLTDFEPYYGVDIGSGIYILKYEILNRDGLYLLVGHDGIDEKPIYVYLVNAETNEQTDIRTEEFQKMLKFFSGAENNEQNRTAALTLGKYMLEKLKDGTYTLDTEIYSNNVTKLMDAKHAALYDKDVFSYLWFVDEHTVGLKLNAGLLDVYGYLVTDGTVNYEPYTQVSVSDQGFDGDSLYIEWSDGDLYYFTAGL